MLPAALTRRLFVVPLAENNHGKTTLIQALVAQGARHPVRTVHRGPRTLYSPWGRVIDALIIPRSYQETLAREFGSVKAALKGVDPQWRQRDLIVFPSHVDTACCQTLIELAHGAGFDAIVLPVLLKPAELKAQRDCLALGWDERWTLANSARANPQGQIQALGHNLWSWIAGALERR